MSWKATVPLTAILALGCGKSTSNPPKPRQSVAVPDATGSASTTPAPAAPRDERLVMRTQPQRLIHGDRIRFVASSAGVIVATDQDQMLRFWDRKTGRQLSATKMKTWVNGLVSMPGTDTVIAAVDDHLHVFGFDGRKQRSQKLSWAMSVRAVAVNAKGTRLAISSYSDVKVLDGKSFEAVAATDELGGAKGLAFAGDAIVVTTSKKVTLWEPGGDTSELVGGTGEPSAVAATVDGQRIAACVGDTVVMWTSDGKLSWTHPAKHCRELAFSPDGKEVVAEISPGNIGRWDAATGTEVGELRARGAVTALAYTQDGALVSGGEDHTVREFNLATGKERHPHDGNQGDVLGVAISTPLATLFTAARDSDVMAWPISGSEIAAPSRIAPTSRWGTRCVALRGKLLAVASDNVEIRDASTRKRIRELSDGHAGCDGLTISPDGKWVAHAELDELHLFDVGDASAPLKVWTAPSEVRSMSFTPDSDLLVVGDDEAGIDFVDIATMKPVFTIDAGASVTHTSVSRDGKLVAAALAENRLKVWRIDPKARSATEHMQLENPDALVWRTTFIPNKPWLAFGTANGRVRVWNYDTKKEVVSFEAHFGFILAMSANEKWLATGGSDRTAALWDVERLAKP